MKLDQLRTFLAVVDHGSFTRAAAALDVSQSTVSLQVATLEGAVGAKLVDRRRGEALLTPSGLVLERYAHSILALVDEAAGAARLEREVATGQVLLEASTIPSAYLLPAVIAKFRAKVPAVMVRLRASDSASAQAALLDQRCDLCVIGSEPSDARIEYLPVARDEVVLIGPPGAPARLASLDGVPMVFREPGSGTRGAVAHLLPARAVVEVGSTEAARRCVLEGIGYSFISRMAVEDDLRDGRLQLVELPGTPVQRQVFAARLRGLTPTAAARALWTALVSPADPVLD
ncbi:MAG: DNA-binding transcriptional LysR family regulator [Myxococcota bacterium]|jgi:DNA-binding transcriptional LysR family regulator